MLREGLLECMSSHLLMAPQALDLVQGKLASADSAQARMDSLDVIAALASRFGVSRCMGVRGVRQLWSLIRLQIVDTSEADMQARARSCLRHLIRLAAEEEAEEDVSSSSAPSAAPPEGAAMAVDDLLSGSVLFHLMKQVKTQCMVDVKSPEEARSRRGASALMCAISAHPRASAMVLGEVLQALRDIVVAPAKGTSASPMVRLQAALEVMLQAVMSARSLWAYMNKEQLKPGTAHPLAPHGRELVECAASVTLYPGGESDESGNAKLAALDILTELVMDEGIVDRDQERKAAAPILTSPLYSDFM
jgi:hypothetical protein